MSVISLFFLDIWEWQIRMEARLAELEKKITEQEQQNADRVANLEHFSTKMCQSVIKNIEELKILREIIKKGKI